MWGVLLRTQITRRQWATIKKQHCCNMSGRIRTSYARFWVLRKILIRARLKLFDAMLSSKCSTFQIDFINQPQLLSLSLQIVPSKALPFVCLLVFSLSFPLFPFQNIIFISLCQHLRHIDIYLLLVLCRYRQGRSFACFSSSFFNLYSNKIPFLTIHF